MIRRFAVTAIFLGPFTLALFAQAPGPDANASSGPAAWVYVSGQIGGANSKAEVHAYAAAANGKLTSLAGFPFAANVSNMAVNGKYLFGASNDSTFIDSYAIESNGGLHYVAQTNTQAVNGCDSEPGSIVLDHTGASLYSFDDSGDAICSNNVYQAYSVTKSSGALKYLNDAGGDEELAGPLTFSSNNQYAYTSDCYHFTAQISGFKRSSTGALTALPYNLPFPSGGWCPYLAAADPAMHLAVPMYPCNEYGCSGTYQLATYTIASDGNLSTTSTPATMPKISVGLLALNMAPSGKLLAVAGVGGLQVFHFNGAAPATKYTGLLTSGEVDEIAWDNSNHLYAIGTAANKLWVFTVTPSSYSLAAQYTVNRPMGIAVLPPPLP